MNKILQIRTCLAICAFILVLGVSITPLNMGTSTSITFDALLSTNYVIVDTDQSKCYDNSEVISYPEENDSFFGKRGSGKC